MANKKITQLTELATPALVDILPIVDDPAGVPETKKVTVEKILTTEAPTLTASGDVKAGGGLSVGSTVTDPATGEIVATGDIKAGSGLVVGNAGTSNNPGNGEVWLQEQSALPSATSSTNKLVDYKDTPIVTNKNSRRYRATSSDILTPFLQQDTIRAVWASLGYRSTGLAISDRVNDFHLSLTSNIWNGSVSSNGLYPIPTIESGATGAYVSYPTASSFGTTNWFSVCGWFYVPSSEAVNRPFMSSGHSALNWSLYQYAGNVQGLIVNTSGLGTYTAGLALIPGSWNFIGLKFYWASAGDYDFRIFCNGNLGAKASDPGSVTRSPTGEFRIFHDGTNSALNYRMSVCSIAGVENNHFYYIYESTKAFYGQ